MRFQLLALGLFVVHLTNTTFAGSEISYYGGDLLQGPLEKGDSLESKLHRILAGKHQREEGKPDKITKDCEKGSVMPSA